MFFIGLVLDLGWGRIHCVLCVGGMLWENDLGDIEVIL